MIYLIYKIHCNITGDDYYGSTKDLNSRMASHKHEATVNSVKIPCKSKQIITGGDYTVSVVESLEVETKQDALWRERYYIENNPCVNDRSPINTPEEIRLRNVKYRIDNKEHIKSVHAVYREVNVAAIAKQQAEYYQANRKNILARVCAKYTCELCGIEIAKSSKSRHEKRSQHQSALAALSTSARIG